MTIVADSVTVSDMDDQHRNTVREERRKRGWSVRRAAGAGHISNTTWGRYEAGELELSGAIRNAIAVAYGWPADWPDTTTPDWDAAVDQARGIVTGIVTGKLEQLQATVNDEVRSQLAEHDGRLLEHEGRLRELVDSVRTLSRRVFGDPAEHDGREQSTG